MRPVLTMRGERQIPNGRDDATEPAERSEIASCQAARTERRDLRQRWGLQRLGRTAATPLPTTTQDPARWPTYKLSHARLMAANRELWRVDG
jgi:hypothetical protein